MRSLFTVAFITLTALALPVVGFAVAPAPTKAAALPLTGSISFVGSKVTGSHTGDFKDWKGSLGACRSIPTRS